MEKDIKSLFLFSSIIAIITGGCLLFAPLASIAAFISIMGFFMVGEGVIRIILVVMNIKNTMLRWGWFLCCGILQLLLGLLLLANHFKTPVVTSLFALSYLQLFFGIGLLISGVTLLMSRNNGENRIPAILQIIGGILFAATFLNPIGSLFFVMFSGASILINGIMLLVNYRKLDKN